MVKLSLFSAIIILLTFTPGLGMIPIGPFQITTVALPVIIGAVVMGPLGGGILGFVFGISSYVFNLMYPGITYLIFINPIITVIPRILIGVFAYYTYAGAKWLWEKANLTNFGSNAVPYVAASIVGSLTNTIFLLGFIYIFESSNYMAAFEIGRELVFGALAAIVVTNGVPEAIGAAIICPAIIKALLAITNQLKK